MVIDNLSSHKGPRTRTLIEAAGASLLVLPPYGPVFDPIEIAFAKLKALLRKPTTRTVESLWTTIGRISETSSPAECIKYFQDAGFDPDWQDDALEWSKHQKVPNSHFI